MKRTRYSAENDGDDDEEYDADGPVRDGLTVYFHCAVNGRSALALCRKLRVCEKLVKAGDTCGYITLRIYSDGGDCSAAFFVVDAIDSISVPIHTVIEGSAASAATLISAAGHVRWATPHSHILLHQISVAGVCGKMTEVCDEVENLKLVSETVKSIYRERTKLTSKNLTEALGNERWWSVQEAHQHGIIDRIGYGPGIDTGKLRRRAGGGKK